MVRKSIKFLALTLFLITLNIQSAHASVSDINSMEDNIYNHLTGIQSLKYLILIMM